MGRERGSARQWHVWRKAFWARPALLLLYATLLGAGGLLMLAAVPGTYTEARAMESAGICATPAESDCLERVPGYLDGPHYKRRAGDKWYLRDGEELAQGFGSFDMATSQSNTLEEVGSDTVVNGLVWEDEIVAVELPDGRRVTTDEFGTSKWWTLLLVAVFALAMAAMLVALALVRRRAVGGWWGVRVRHEPPPVSGRAMALACLLGAPAMLGILPMMFLNSVWVSAVAAVVGLGLGVLAAARVRRGGARRDEPAAAV